MMKKAVTHNGSFHADDVFASVVLQKVFKGIKIRRTRDEKEIARADVVFDIGRVYDPATGRFDHHQPDGLKRKNGVPYSAFGLIWKEFGEKYCDNAKVAKRIDEKLVQQIDANDNGVTTTKSLVPGLVPMTWDDIISTFEPNFFDNTDSVNKQFNKAIEFARTFLERMVEKEKDNLEKIKYVAEMIKKSPDERYVILDEAASYDEIAFAFPKLLFVVYPKKTDDIWSVRALKKSEDSYQTKKPFPAEWAGKVDDELAKVTGVEDALFAHNGRFIVTAKTREGALALLDKALS